MAAADTEDSDEVALQPAERSDAAVLSSLLELYIHDLSAYFSIQIGEDGRFGYERLAQYWEEPDRHFAYLIRRNDRLAGFVLATRGSPLTADPNDLDVAEFFVLRAERRSLVGRRAARLLWNDRSGHWIVRVAERNVHALAFWRATIADYTGRPVSERRVELPGRAWHVLDFESLKVGRG